MKMCPKYISFFFFTVYAEAYFLSPSRDFKDRKLTLSVESMQAMKQGFQNISLSIVIAYTKTTLCRAMENTVSKRTDPCRKSGGGARIQFKVRKPNAAKGTYRLRTFTR